MASDKLSREEIEAAIAAARARRGVTRQPESLPPEPVPPDSDSFVFSSGTSGVDVESEPEPDIPPFPHDTVSAAPAVSARSQSPRQVRRYVPALIVAGVFAAFLGLVYWAYSLVTTGDGDAAVPLITAEPGAEKVRPESEGGIEVLNQDREVFNQVARDPDAPQIEHLLPPPEAPVAPPEPPADAEVTIIMPEPEAQVPGASSDDIADAEQSPTATPEGEVSVVPGADAVVSEPPGSGTDVAVVPVPVPSTISTAPAPALDLPPAAGADLPAASGETPMIAVIPPIRPAAPPPVPAAAVPTAPQESPQPTIAPAVVAAPATLPATPQESPQPTTAPAVVTAPVTLPATPQIATVAPPAPAAAPTAAQADTTATAAAVPAPEPEPSQTAVGTNAHRVQLGAFKTTTAARTAWARLQSIYPDLLGDLTLILDEADSGSTGTLYRVQGGPLSGQRDAEALCNRLKEQNQACLVIRP